MSRRSIRKYKDQPVEREKLETIVNCGINAGRMTKSRQLRVVDNADYINGITEVFKSQSEGGRRARFQEYVPRAPAVIFIASPKDGSGQLDCGLLGEKHGVSGTVFGARHLLSWRSDCFHDR